MHGLIPHSQLRIYHGGHFELAADAERLASAVEAFLNADLTLPAGEHRSAEHACRGPGTEATLLLDWMDGEPTVPVADAATGISFELPVAL